MSIKNNDISHLSYMDVWDFFFNNASFRFTIFIGSQLHFIINGSNIHLFFIGYDSTFDSKIFKFQN